MMSIYYFPKTEVFMGFLQVDIFIPNVPTSRLRCFSISKRIPGIKIVPS